MITHWKKIKLGYELLAWSLVMNYFLAFTSRYLDLLTGSGLAIQQPLMLIGTMTHYRLPLVCLAIFISILAAVLEINGLLPERIRMAVRIIIALKMSFLFFLLSLPIDLTYCCVQIE